MTEHCPSCGVVLKDRNSRSKRSHDHFFVAMNELWQTLPEGSEARYPNAESFRKAALIATGHCDVRTLVCSSKALAERAVQFAKQLDPSSIVTARDNVVTAYTAHSQSMKAMGKAMFQKSKDDCLAWALKHFDDGQGSAAANNRPEVAA